MCFKLNVFEDAEIRMVACLCSVIRKGPGSCSGRGLTPSRIYIHNRGICATNHNIEVSGVTTFIQYHVRFPQGTDDETFSQAVLEHCEAQPQGPRMSIPKRQFTPYQGLHRSADVSNPPQVAILRIIHANFERYFRV